MRKYKTAWTGLSCPVSVSRKTRNKKPPAACGAPSRVLRTTRLTEQVLRHRVCREGHRFTTEEKSQ